MIRRRKRDGGFFLFLLIHALINFDGTAPAWILLALHIWLDISVWWSVAAFALWAAWVLLWVLVIDWASSGSSKADVPRENKNPYSVGNQKTDLEQNKF